MMVHDSKPPNNNIPLPSFKQGWFHNATDEELAVTAAAGIFFPRILKVTIVGEHTTLDSSRHTMLKGCTID